MRLALSLLVLGLLTACGSNPARKSAISSTGTPTMAQLAANDTRTKAQAGDVVAERELGKMYLDGRGVPRDYYQAKVWLDTAATAGDLEAETDLAVMDEAGMRMGMLKDPPRAHALLQDAASHGYPKAESAFGFDYLYGVGTPVDYPQALTWFRKAAADGDADGTEAVGYMYWHGLAVATDVPTAMSWYKQAADRGSLHAQLFVAGTYGLGLDVPQDKAASDAYFAQVASHVMQAVPEMSETMKAIVEIHAHLNYPADAVKQGQHGTVKVGFDVVGQKAGNIHVDHSSGYPLLDAAARRAVQDSTFPGRVTDLNVYTHFAVEVDFDSSQKHEPFAPGSPPQ